jgi:hypothetical protein
MSVLSRFRILNNLPLSTHGCARMGRSFFVRGMVTSQAALEYSELVSTQDSVARLLRKSSTGTERATSRVN